MHCRRNNIEINRLWKKKHYKLRKHVQAYTDFSAMVRIECVFVRRLRVAVASRTLEIPTRLYTDMLSVLVMKCRNTDKR